MEPLTVSPIVLCVLLGAAVLFLVAMLIGLLAAIMNLLTEFWNLF